MTTNPTCINCPAFVGEGDHTVQSQLYGKVTGAASCARHGKVLATPDMRAASCEQSFAEHATTCHDFGKPFAKVSGKVTLKIGFGAPEAPGSHSACNSCRSCHYLAPASKSIELVGMNMPLCTKFGNLVPEPRASAVAKKCTAATRINTSNTGQHIESLMSTFNLDPLLGKFIELNNGVASSGYGGVDTDTDPAQYSSDRDVTPQQSAIGIRAWRRIDGPRAPVYLPIFDPEHFTPEERALIPVTGSDEHPENYVDHMGLVYVIACLWMELDETPALHGEAGTGKTELFRHMAWLMQLPFTRISITEDSERDDLEGKLLFENNETVFQYGQVSSRWNKPGVILLDEPNVGPSAVWQFIRPLTDNSKQLAIGANKGEIIQRNSFAFLGMAMNPAWDPRNVGAAVLGDADGSRLMHLFVTLPEPELEREIIKARCKLDDYDISENTLNKIMKIAESLRSMSEDQTLAVTWGIRPQIKVARATKWFEMPRAYQLAVADYLEPQQKATILDIVDQKMKER
ncbi:AAA-ATPase [Gordonia phage Teatealatte]|uniref:AAA-ATPase n=2 Tax=Demosthenesvirus katyusha TaxID=1982108 RepID=A0A345MCC2_9CAUD|nr:AAA-ATPase [Gordonia phage Teatealatte]QBP29641.1 AAA-ATPase [Gordonia phage Tredge]